MASKNIDLFTAYVGEVVTMVTHMGEIVGRLKSNDTSFVVVEKPRLFVSAGDQSGFLPGVSATGKQNPEEVRFHNFGIITIVETEQSIIDAWIQQTTGIVTP